MREKKNRPPRPMKASLGRLVLADEAQPEPRTPLNARKSSEHRGTGLLPSYTRFQKKGRQEQRVGATGEGEKSVELNLVMLSVGGRGEWANPVKNKENRGDIGRERNGNFTHGAKRRNYDDRGRKALSASHLPERGGMFVLGKERRSKERLIEGKHESSN